MLDRPGSPRVLCLAVASVVLLMAPGCGTPQSAGTSTGWSQLPDSPLPFERERMLSFWTGAELVVAGGTDVGPLLEGSADDRELTFTGLTVAYDPGAGEWSELDPLKIPGYDGIDYGDGMWTGAEWLGYGLPCRNGVGTDREAVGLCAERHVGLRWAPGEGWSVLQDLPADLYLGAVGFPSPTLIGISGAGMVFTGGGGYLLLDAAAAQQWTFQSWPTLPEGTLQSGGCLVGEELWTRGTDDPLADAGGPTEATLFVTAVDLKTGTGRVLTTRPPTADPKGIALSCLPDGLLFQVQGEISRLGVDEAVSAVEAPPSAIDPDLPVGPGNQLPLDLGDDQVTNERGTIAFGLQPWLLEPDTMRFTKLSPTLDMEHVTSGAGVVFGQVDPSFDTAAAGQWFQLNTDSAAADLASAAFPIPADTPLRSGQP